MLNLSANFAQITSDIYHQIKGNELEINSTFSIEMYNKINQKQLHKKYMRHK